MAEGVTGIHHVTAIGGEPVTNMDFYTRVLGLRMVKRTVNYDDPTTWHLYYADRLGHPGTNMTFFPHPMARRGQSGSGETACTMYAVPDGTLEPWQSRLEGEGVRVSSGQWNERQSIEFEDPQGTRLGMVQGQAFAGVQPWAGDGLPQQMAISGFDGVRLALRDVERSATFLQELFKYEQTGQTQYGRWLSVAGDGPGRHIELVESTEPTARMGAGSVHHVAFRVPDEEAQLAIRQKLIDAGLGVTEVKERQYFRSIYFREPGGVIFEVATDGPGFTIDESEAELGQAIKLPPWLEPHRQQLEQALPPLTQETA